MTLRKPKGILIPIGGGEDKTNRTDVLERVLEESGKRKANVCLITVATSLPKEVAQDYKNAFKNIGKSELKILHFDTRAEADSPKNIEKVKNADVILFSGGDQLKISSLLGGTKLVEIIVSRYLTEPNFVVAGTSAGAAVMSDTMIIAGSSQDALIKGELELTNGLDLIDNVFIDTHFTQRGRFGRLIQTVTSNPGVLGIGLGEDTGVVIYRGEELQVIGSGLVVVADGGEISYTNLTEISNGEAITVEGIKLHVLSKGKRFSIIDKKIILEGKKVRRMKTRKAREKSKAKI